MKHKRREKAEGRAPGRQTGMATIEVLEEISLDEFGRPVPRYFDGGIQKGEAIGVLGPNQGSKPGDIVRVGNSKRVDVDADSRRDFGNLDPRSGAARFGNQRYRGGRIANFIVAIAVVVPIEQQVEASTGADFDQREWLAGAFSDLGERRAGAGPSGVPRWFAPAGCESREGVLRDEPRKTP